MKNDADQTWDRFNAWIDSQINKPQRISSAQPKKRNTAKLRAVPMTLKDAKTFVDQFHRHHKAPQGHKVSIGVKIADELIGVGIFGRPVARKLDDGLTAEITRLCVKEGNKNACSFLISRLAKCAAAMGYERIYTYTLETESGGSLRASGWQNDGTSPGGSWSSASRHREDKHPLCAKIRWVKHL